MQLLNIDIVKQYQKNLYRLSGKLFFCIFKNRRDYATLMEDEKPENSVNDDKNRH